jgi:magnesium transporter
VEAPVQEQFYLSSLLFIKVLAADGSVLGKSRDFEVNLDQSLPEITSLVYGSLLNSANRWMVTWDEVASVTARKIILKPNPHPERFIPEPGLSTTRISLRDFLLDKQIVDVHGAKVVRVNDLQFVLTDGKLRLVQVDVGIRGLLRRLGFENPLVRFFKWFFDYTLKEQFIRWQYVQPLGDPDRLKLQIPQSKLAELHPADLADIIEDMDVHERAAVVQSLDDEVLADALEEMDPRVQVSIVRGLEPEKAADILEEMSPDDAADLIADLPKETAEDILDEMEDEYQAQVKGLLVHDEDEAGGLMTNRFLALGPNQTIVDALAHIRQKADDVDVIYYVYILDRESHLLGVVNLRELLSNEIFTPLERIMTSRLMTAKIDDDAGTLADMFGKYGFRAIPVTDEENHMKGVIRFKTIMEIVAPHLGK